MIIWRWEEAKVIGGFEHSFEVGEIVILIKEVTDEYYADGEVIEERYFQFIKNRQGYPNFNRV